MEVNMRKVLCYIYNEMADFEISLLLHRLKNTGKMEIVSVSESLEPLYAQSGLCYVPEMTMKDITALEDFEAVIIPGGPINNAQNDICPILEEMTAKGKLVAAICFAPQFLGRAGILKNYQFTTSCTEEKIKQLGCKDPFYRPNYVEARTVTDRNVITAKGYAFVDFTAVVCDYLHIFENQQQKYEQLGRIKE